MPSILVVANEPATVQSLRELLRREFQVYGTANPSEALATLRHQDVHLILADYRLPGTNGLSFLRQVRGEFPEVVGVLFAGAADPWVDSAVTGQRAGFRYIPRPWEADELLPVLQQALEQYQEQTDSQRCRVRNWPSKPDAGGLPTTLRPGDRIGQYRLLEWLGQGSMGAVFKAVHVLLQRVVALKVVAGEQLRDPVTIARFRREMRAIGRLHDPHIVQASDARMVRGVPFLVMEFIDGLDLAKLVARAGPLSVPDACEICRQAALGLQHAHAQGLIHRDLKPANLMLTAAGQVKILDLGLALWYGEPTKTGHAGGAGVVVGTADYIAPEQVLGYPPVDARVDLYSLGCTLYELLTGLPPFSGPRQQTITQKLQAHVRAKVPPIRRRPQIPRGLAQVLNRLLAKDPQDRYGAPVEMEVALRPLATGADLPRLVRDHWHGQALADANQVTAQQTVDYRPRVGEGAARQSSNQW